MAIIDINTVKAENQLGGQSEVFLNVKTGRGKECFL